MAARAHELGAEAERDLDEAITTLEGARRDRGMSFLLAFEETLRMIVEYPDIGRRARRRVRVFAMTGWPYKVVYSLEGDLVMVWAVAHDKRKSGYWRKRVPH
jgi:ParE toxin of type II toxin-antitoxin system, parDE